MSCIFYVFVWDESVIKHLTPCHVLLIITELNRLKHKATVSLHYLHYSGKALGVLFWPRTCVRCALCWCCVCTCSWGECFGDGCGFKICLGDWVVIWLRFMCGIDNSIPPVKVCLTTLIPNIHIWKHGFHLQFQWCSGIIPLHFLWRLFLVSMIQTQQ